MKRVVFAALGALLFIGFGAGLLRLETRFDPAALVYAEGAPAPDVAIFRVDGVDLNALSSVERLHLLTRRLESEGAHVLSPTNLPLPHFGEGDLDAILSLIEAAPEHFPQGLAGLGARIGGELVVGPIVENEVGEREREALANAAPSLEASFLSGERALIVASGISAERARDLGEELRLPTTGLGVLELQLESRLRDEALRLLVTALLLQALFLGVLFRRMDGVFLPLMAAGVALLITMGIAGWLAIPLSLLTAIVPPVLLTIAVGDALHVLVRYGHESQHGTGAAERARGSMLRPCLATSLTTAAGFFSLCFAETPAVRTFGLLTVFGVGVAFLVVIVLVPALLRWSPKAPARWAALAHSEPIASLALGARRRRGLVAVLTMVLLALCAYAAPHVSTGTRLLSPFEADDPAAILAREIDRDFGGIRRMEWMIDGELSAESLARVRRLVALAESHGANVRASSTVLDAVWSRFSDAPLPERAIAPLARLAAPALADLVRDGEHRLFLSLRDRSAESLAALGRSAQEAGARVSGEAWQAGVGLTRLQKDLASTFGFAFGSVFLVIALLFGLRAVVSALLPNLLPLLLIVAYMALRGIPLDVSSAMVFAVTLGLVVDGTLHLLSAHRESGAIRAAYARTGGAVLWGGVLLALGFASLMFSSLVPLQRFGELAFVAIASGTLAELLLLPSMLGNQR